MPEFTPGPWRYEPAPSNFEDGVVVSADGTYIAQTSYDGQSGTKANDERADGCLIAAAPEMYEALEQIAALRGEPLLGDMVRARLIAGDALAKITDVRKA